MKNTDTPTIYFDLDGTVYDLYGQTDWLRRITTDADPSAYANENATLVDMVALQEVLLSLMDRGYTIGVVSWLSKTPADGYNALVRAVKKEWIRKFLPMATEVHIVKYGTPKHRVIRNKKNAIIVDDCTEVRYTWKRGQTIDATGDIITALANL